MHRALSPPYASRSPPPYACDSLNCYIVRRPEISRGVSLVDDGRNPVLSGEASQAAARRAVISTTATRAILQVLEPLTRNPTHAAPPRKPHLPKLKSTCMPTYLIPDADILHPALHSGICDAFEGVLARACKRVFARACKRAFIYQIFPRACLSVSRSARLCLNPKP